MSVIRRLLLISMLVAGCAAPPSSDEPLPGFTAQPFPQASPITGFGGTVSGIDCDAGEYADGYHIHLTLKLTGPSGETLALPNGIGVGPECSYWLRTEDASGEIHLEAPSETAPLFADFLEIWRRSADPTIPDAILGGIAEVLVDGESVLDTAFPLVDGQLIEVTILGFFEEA